MKTALVKVMALVLMASAFLAVSCRRGLDENTADMAEVIGRGDLIVVTEVSEGSFTVLYCKKGGKTFGVVGEDPMFDGERFEFSDVGYTYLGDHEVLFQDKPSPVVMPIYAKKGSTNYYVYLTIMENHVVK